MIEDILDECLREIQARRVTVDDCLRKYPQYAEELGPLLEIARAIQDVPDIEPSEAFKRATRARLFDTPRNGKPKSSPGKTNPGEDRPEREEQDADASPGKTSLFASATAMPKLARN